MKDSRYISTSTYLNLIIEKDGQGLKIEITKYKGIKGSLLYLFASWPDIMFSVYMCAKFQASPNESHFKVVKCILRYLKGSLNYNLWYTQRKWM